MENQPKKKKPYPGKPDIIFESFAINTSISAGCEVRGNHAGYPSCGYTNSVGQNVFSTVYPDTCTVGSNSSYNDPSDSPDKGFICWTAAGNGAAYSHLFNS